MPGTSLPPANQPTKQPRAPLMLLLQISGRLLGCLPAGTIGRCVFPSSFRQFFPLFILIPLPTLYLRSTSLCPVSSRHPVISFFLLSVCASFPLVPYRVPSLPRLSPPCLHFILRHALSLSFSFPRDTRSFVTIVGNGVEVEESMASGSSRLLRIRI